MANPAQELSDALADAVERVSQSVLRVETGRRRPASGLVWSADGLVVTAAHALEREEGLELNFESGESRSATLVGADLASDIALLRCEGGPLETPERAPESALRRGQLVLALGRPGRSVRSTLGVISALGDQWRTHAGGKIERYVQSDVAIEAGFSGGPLIDASGRLVGLNSAALVRSAAMTLPVSTLQRVISELLAHGRIQRGYLGVSCSPARLPEGFGQAVGLIVIGLQPEGPAERAGLLLGDVLLSLDGARLESISELQAALEDRAGKSAPVRLLRAGTEAALSITPSARS